MKRIQYFGIGLALCVSTFALPVRAQSSANSQNQPGAQGQAQSGSSLGDYARQVRKDSGTPAKSRPTVRFRTRCPWNSKKMSAWK